MKNWLSMVMLVAISGVLCAMQQAPPPYQNPPGYEQLFQGTPPAPQYLLVALPDLVAQQQQLQVAVNYDKWDDVKALCLQDPRLINAALWVRRSSQECLISTIMHIALAANNPIFSELLELRPNMHALDGEANSLVMIAAGNPNPELLQTLLDRDSTNRLVHYPDRYGNTPLSYAVLQFCMQQDARYLENIRLLLVKGACLNVSIHTCDHCYNSDNPQNIVVWMSCWAFSVEVIRLFLEVSRPGCSIIPQEIIEQSLIYARDYGIDETVGLLQSYLTRHYPRSELLLREVPGHVPSVARVPSDPVLDVDQLLREFNVTVPTEENSRQGQ